MNNFFKCFLLISVLSLAAYAEIQKRSRFGPSLISTNVDTSIAAAGTGIKNCLSNLDAQANSIYTIRVLDGGTTIYAMDLSSGSSIVRSFEDGDMCGTANTAMYIRVSTVGANVLSMNYQGYTY